MGLTKDLIKNYFLPFFNGIGGDKLLRWSLNKKHLNIMFHGVVDDDLHLSKRNIKPSDFERLIIYLKKNFKIITLKEALKAKQEKLNMEEHTVSISFDDGFRNNLTIALPILEKHAVKATVFVSSVIGEHNFNGLLYPEMISSLKYFYRDQEIMISDRSYYNMISQNNKTYLQDDLNLLSYDERQKLVNRILEKYQLIDKLQQVSPDLWKMLSIDELKMLHKSDFIEIGSHGHLHYKLPNISLEKSKLELSVSKKILEEILGEEIDMFAYPYGEYNMDLVEIAQDIGYKYQYVVNYNHENDALDSRILGRHGIATTTNLDVNILLLNLKFRKVKK